VGTYSNHGFEMTGDEEVRAEKIQRNSSSVTIFVAAQVQKINQDRGSIEYPLLSRADQALFCVFDGHGPGACTTLNFDGRQPHDADPISTPADGSEIAEASMITMHTTVIENLESDPHEVHPPCLTQPWPPFVLV